MAFFLKIGEKMNIEQIFEIEPRLWEIEARCMRGEKWYGRGGLRSEMANLVGFCAEKEELSSPACYDVVYGHFIRILGL